MKPILQSRRLWLVLVSLAAIAGSVAYTLAPTGPAFVNRIPGQNTIRAEVIFPNPNTPAGLAHYTEHLVWENAIGGPRDADSSSNAWTSSVAVGYWLSGKPEDLVEILQTLRGVFDPLAISPEFAAEEVDIVLREYDFRVSGNPVANADEVAGAYLYSGNAIATSVIGTPAEISEFTYEAAKAFHQATHTPENAVLLVTGDVSDRQVRRALADAGWPDLRAPEKVLSPQPFEIDQTGVEQIEVADPDSSPRLIWRRVIELPEPVPFDLLEAQTALLRDILDTNLPGGIAGPLRFDNPIVRGYDLWIWPIDEDNVEVAFAATPETAVTLAELEEAFAETLVDIAADGIPHETYRRVSRRFGGFWPDWTDAEHTAEWMAGYVVDRVSNLRPPLDIRALKRLDSELSYPGTNALLRHIATEGRTTIAYTGPKDQFE